MKMNIVKNERRRILSKCGNEELKQKHNWIFDRLLCENEYPALFIQKSYEPLQILVSSLFVSYNDSSLINHPNRTLRNVLSKRAPDMNCNLPQCKMSTSGLCMRSYVVTKDPDPVNLRLKEALLIRSWSPTKSSREELCPNDHINSIFNRPVSSFKTNKIIDFKLPFYDSSGIFI
jgi:hypothetical protein